MPALAIGQLQELLTRITHGEGRRIIMPGGDENGDLFTPRFSIEGWEVHLSIVNRMRKPQLEAVTFLHTNTQRTESFSIVPRSRHQVSELVANNEIAAREVLIRVHHDEVKTESRIATTLAS